jgi:Rrf2 family protein
MFRYGKLARQAVSAISYVAERHQGDAIAVSSGDVGKARNIPKALAAKLLSEAASAGLLKGTTGPGGGYRLARPPEEISLMEVVELFERPMAESPCPFGPGWCGKGEPCPLHNDFEKLETKIRSFLEGTSFSVFVKQQKAKKKAKKVN